MGKKQNRCWPGYEPVSGKDPHSQGSCRPKAESKSTASEKQFRAKRHEQLIEQDAKHQGKSLKDARNPRTPSKTGPTTSKPATKKKQQATGSKTGSQVSASKRKDPKKRTSSTRERSS